MRMASECVLFLDLLLDLPSRLSSLLMVSAANESLVRVLRDLLLDGDVLLAFVCICLCGCPAVRRKIARKCPSGIHVH